LRWDTFFREDLPDLHAKGSFWKQFRTFARISAKPVGGCIRSIRSRYASLADNGRDADEIGRKIPSADDFSLLFYIWINLFAGLLQSRGKYRSIRARPGARLAHPRPKQTKSKNLGSSL
jgi:hypothetical protein